MITIIKQILVLGGCALFIACGSSAEKTMDADTTSVQVADTSTAAIAADTTIKEFITVAPEKEVSTVSKTPATPTPAPVATSKAKVNENQAVAPEKTAQPVDNADTKKGEILVSKSDCFACHKIQDKLVGPAYKDVANKYAKTKANIDYLVDKIKKGGSGVWGAIPMSPHPALSDEDAKAMVQYILTLK